MTECVVVGSGPAGVAAAKALLANKKKVVMLDVGKELPIKQQKIVSSLQQKPPWLWKPVRSSDALQKRKFDSAYMYQTPDLRIKSFNAHANASFAKGGLSSVWGAAMLPYEQDDMHAWPQVDLSPYYKKVLSFVPLAGTHDDLERRFPLFTAPEELHSSPQAQALLDHWNKHRVRLKKNGFVFGQSRLAVKAFPEKELSGCVYCGLCMTGCPYDLIYSTEHTLAELQQDNNFTYIHGVVVEEVTEKKGVPFVIAKKDGKEVGYSGTKIFLAMGVYSTTNILLRSLKKKTVTLHDSQYIIIPCLSKKRGRLGKQHALSQAFIELRDEELGNVHLQVYTFSDLIEQGVAGKLGFLYAFLRPFLRPLVERLLVVQGFLHSDVSGTLVVEKTESGMFIKGSSSSVKKRLPKVLLRHTRKLGLFPLIPLVEYGLPGQGFHSGGSFPMRDNPEEGESDVLGRCGFTNIHVVDSSVLPSIAGTTITLTEMANAYRIADVASRWTT